MEEGSVEGPATVAGAAHILPQHDSGAPHQTQFLPVLEALPQPVKYSKFILFSSLYTQYVISVSILVVLHSFLFLKINIIIPSILLIGEKSMVQVK